VCGGRRWTGMPSVWGESGEHRHFQCTKTSLYDINLLKNHRSHDQ